MTAASPQNRNNTKTETETIVQRHMDREAVQTQNMKNVSTTIQNVKEWKCPHFDDNFMLLATGSSARVYCNSLSRTVFKVAPKSLALYVRREMKIMDLLKEKGAASNPHILMAREYVTHEEYDYIVFPYGGHALVDILHSLRFDWQKESIISQVIKAVSFLHDNGILHRDIKLDNILVTSEYHTTLCDFGFASAPLDMNKKSSFWGGTEWYLSPEIISRTPYDPRKADYWAMGICFFGIWFNRFPFHNLNVDPEPFASFYKEVIQEGHMSPFSFFTKRNSDLILSLPCTDFLVSCIDTLLCKEEHRYLPYL